MLTTATKRPVCLNCQYARIQQTQQTRAATLIRRPKRPYTFTQLITLSDGSTFLHRTTSPAPVYTSTRDTKNHALWNPSSQKLNNAEDDEAGRLKKFRSRFGRGWDIDAQDMAEGETEQADSLLDLMAPIPTNVAQEKNKKKAATTPENHHDKGKDQGSK